MGGDRAGRERLSRELAELHKNNNAGTSAVGTVGRRGLGRTRSDGIHQAGRQRKRMLEKNKRVWSNSQE